MEGTEQHLPQQGSDPIPRPNSTSAAEAAVSQLLGMTGGLPEGANGNGESAHDPSLMDATPSQPDAEQQQPQAQPQQQPQHQSQQPVNHYNGATPAATAGGNHNGMPTCQNCSTSTTPLWRRDEYGAVLCNACGLFLKLHGRPRPISLKTDVIKSRNRVKTMRPDVQGKKKTSTPTQPNAARKHAHNANADGTNDSPISRTGTPSMYNQPLPDFMMDNPYSSTGLSGFNANGDGSNSPMNSDTPQTAEQLIATNSSLKTRVRELELINELFRGRLGQLEQQEAAARRGNEVAAEEQTQLREQIKMAEENASKLSTQLEDSHSRERSLKRRLDEIELELAEARGESDRPTKKQRFPSPPAGEKPVPLASASTPELGAEAEAQAAPEPEMAADTES